MCCKQIECLLDGRQDVGLLRGTPLPSPLVSRKLVDDPLGRSETQALGGPAGPHRSARPLFGSGLVP